MVTPPIQSIAHAAVLRDNLAVALTKLVREYEEQTALKVQTLSVQRKEVRDRRGYKSISTQIGVIVMLEGNGI